MKAELFDFKNMPALVNRVYDLWCPPDSDEAFKRIYVEGIIRLDMHKNNFQFQITENNQLKAIACASKKGEKNGAAQWWDEKYKNLTESQKYSFKLCREYLSLMDQKTFAFMNDDDVKLNLFISIEKGWGKTLLDNAISIFKNEGFKNMFLWTDCECNVDWYFQHGYELVDEDTYEPFSRDEDYKTYVFKKNLI